jgi:hypothetical protein
MEGTRSVPAQPCAGRGWGRYLLPMLVVASTTFPVVARAADPPPADDDEAGKKEEARAGETVDSDYVAKNFTLLTGAVILNPFKIRKDPDDPKIQKLETGTTAARAFIEGGYRRRWAWEDRVAPAKETAAKLEKAKADLEALEKKRKEVERERKVAEILQEKNTEAEKKAILDDLDRKIAAAEQSAKNAQNAHDAARSAWKTEPLAKSLRERVMARGWREALVDDGIDLVGRMGFAFEDDTDGAAGIAGGSDFYIEAVTGLNLLRWTSRTNAPQDTPTRFALNFEPALSVSTDRDLVDTHTRLFLGPSLVIGFPFRLIEKKEEADGNAKGESDSLAPDPVGELMFRVGGVRVETPQFVDDDGRTIEVKNEVADFDTEWGVGFDAEVNLPVTKSLGYLTARGSINMNMDPNPWSLTLGYTIPLSQFQKVLLGGDSE